MRKLSSKTRRKHVGALVVIFSLCAPVSRAAKLFIATLAAIALAVIVPASAATPPPIRLSATNHVPACVTPERLIRFLKTRNKNLSPRFRSIAHYYRKHGRKWRVRWDYAFFQMAIETNFLTYRRPNGKSGDVSLKQNNFAGIGTTGGGVPGNQFPSVSSGVLAQIHHLVVYSGEFIANPVAPRTRLKQNVILELSRPIAARRAVTFQDLSGRWAVDTRYGRSIEHVANLYRAKFCRSRDPAILARDTRKPHGHVRPLLSKKHSNPRSRPHTETHVKSRIKIAQTRHSNQTARIAQSTLTAQAPQTHAEVCKVQVAGERGAETLLIHARRGTVVRLTALDVRPGQEQLIAQSFIKLYAHGGAAIGHYHTRTAALREAHALCKRITQIKRFDTAR